MQHLAFVTCCLLSTSELLPPHIELRVNFPGIVNSGCAVTAHLDTFNGTEPLLILLVTLSPFFFRAMHRE